MPYSDPERQRAAQRAWEKANPRGNRKEDLEKKRARRAAWGAANKDRVADYNRSYRQSHREQENRRKAQRNRDDLQSKIGLNLRKRLTSAIKGRFKGGSAVAALGCSIEHLILRLEAMWVEGMSWDNYGPKGWHIDHIKPLSEFDLTDPAQVSLACHYRNLQPLWAGPNIAKGGKNRRNRQNRAGNSPTRVEMGVQELAPVPVSETRISAYEKQ